MPRRNFLAAVKVAAFRRAEANGCLCEGGCGAPLRTGHFAYDHIIPDGLSGEPTLANCQVLCTDGPEGGCHGRKTRRQDAPAIAKAKRREAASLDAKPATARPMRGGKADPVKRTVDGRLVPRAPSPSRRSALPPRPLFL